MLNKGVKRKRGTAESAGPDAPASPAAPATSLFSLSVVKLHRSLRHVEPDLRPLVLVTNALRRLQDQMQTEAAAPEPPGTVLRCPAAPPDGSGALPDCPTCPLDGSGAPLDSSGALPDCPTGPLDSSGAPLDSSGTLPDCPMGPLEGSGAPLDSSGALPDWPTGPLDGSSAPLDSSGILLGTGPAMLLPSLDVSLGSSVSGLLGDLEPAGSLVPALWGAECGARALLAPLPDEGLEGVFEDIDTSMYDGELWAPAGLKALAPAPGEDEAAPGPEDGGLDINDLDLLMDVLVGPRGL